MVNIDIAIEFHSSLHKNVAEWASAPHCTSAQLFVLLLSPRSGAKEGKSLAGILLAYSSGCARERAIRPK